MMRTNIYASPEKLANDTLVERMATKDVTNKNIPYSRRWPDPQASSRSPRREGCLLQRCRQNEPDEAASIT